MAGTSATAASGTGLAALAAVLAKWWRLCSLWFTGAEKWKARGFAVLVISMSFVNTMFMVRISYAQRNFSTALSGKDVPGFYSAVKDFVIIIVIAVPLFTLNTFLEDRLVLSWRAYLTNTLLAAYFDNRSYFHLRQQLSTSSATESGIDNSKGDGTCELGGLGPSSPNTASSQLLDNPDQRICDDIGAFCRSSTSITLALIKKVMNCTAFARVLWHISPSLVMFLFAYALFGTAATTGLFGRILTTLYFKLLAQEGNLRFSLVRVREHAESIAFYRGDAQEHRVVQGRFAQVLHTAAERIKWSALYDMWTSLYNYATILAPSLIVGPRYFRGEVEFGVISQASFAFSSIDSALSVIINNLAQLSGLAAETERLDALRTALMQKSQQQWSCLSNSDGIQIQRVPSGECLRLQQLCVQLPGTKTTVWKDLSLVLKPGQSLLIVGPSGCGKSSLLRALSGLWSQGSGTVLVPPARDTFFLPQKPFMPLGSLRQQLCFPSACGLGSDVLGASSPTSPSSGGEPHTAGSDRAGLSPTVSKLSSAAAAAAVAGTGAATVTATPARDGPGVRSSKQHYLRQGTKGRGMNDSEEEQDADVELAPLLSQQRNRGEAGRVVAGLQGTSGSEEDAAPEVADISDALLGRLLSEACLPDLAQRVGSLDTELDWSHVLSSGEQQRVAFVRLLLHRPRLACLDEATSAMDLVTEAKLYEHLARRLPCYVSVGHRLQLVKYHTHVLEHNGGAGAGGAWTLHTAREYQQRLDVTQQTMH